MELPFKEGMSFTFLHNDRPRTIEIERISPQAIHDSESWCIVSVKVLGGYVILSCTSEGEVTHCQSNLPIIDNMIFHSTTEPIIRLTSIGCEISITDPKGSRWQLTLKADGRRDTLKHLSST